MKTTKHITFLLLTLIISANAYAQKAKPATGMNDILFITDPSGAEASKEAQAQAAKRIKALYAGDKISTSSITANYSNKYSTMSITASNTEGGMDQNIAVKIKDECTLNAGETLRTLANAVDRSTAFNEKIIVTKAALLAISQSVEAMSKKGTFPKYITESMDVTLSLKQDAEGSFKVFAKLTTDDIEATAELDVVKNKDVSYQISGTAGNTVLSLKLTANDNSFIIRGESEGEEVKVTVSTLIDLSLRLDSSSVLKVNGNGTPIKTRLAVNNEDGSHTVVETPLNGDETTSVYKGNTLIPFEEYKILASDVVVETLN